MMMPGTYLTNCLSTGKSETRFVVWSAISSNAVSSPRQKLMRCKIRSTQKSTRRSNSPKRIHTPNRKTASGTFISKSEMALTTYVEAIRQGIWEEMERDDRVFVLGEDVGIYGGAFKVTAGMLEKF